MESYGLSVLLAIRSGYEPLFAVDLKLCLEGEAVIAGFVRSRLPAVDEK
jgi:hypothetical protein